MGYKVSVFLLEISVIFFEKTQCLGEISQMLFKNCLSVVLNNVLLVLSCAHCFLPYLLKVTILSSFLV